MGSSIPASAPADAGAPALTAPRTSRARRTRWMALAGGVFVLVLVVVAVAAPLIAPYDPVRQSLRGRLSVDDRRVRCRVHAAIELVVMT